MNGYRKAIFHNLKTSNFAVNLIIIIIIIINININIIIIIIVRVIKSRELKWVGHVARI